MLGLLPVQGVLRSVSEDVASLRLELGQQAESAAPLSLVQQLQSSFQERQHRMEGALMQVSRPPAPMLRP